MKTATFTMRFKQAKKSLKESLFFCNIIFCENDLFFGMFSSVLFVPKSLVSADSPFFPVISFSRKCYSWKYKGKLFGMLSVNSKNLHLTTILQRFIFNWGKQPFLVSADSHAKFRVLFLRLGSAILESTRILSSILTVFSKKNVCQEKGNVDTKTKKISC